MNIDGNQFIIEKSNKSHKRSSFSCGISALDHYIHSQSGQDNRKNISVTFVLNDIKCNKIAGYYTLSSSSIELKDLPEKLIRKLPKYPLVPATLIGRLAVDLNYQKQGLGELILMDALEKSKQASREIASFAVIVDAINEYAVNFYKKYGFISLLSDKNKFYLPMKTIEKL